VTPQFIHLHPQGALHQRVKAMSLQIQNAIKDYQKKIQNIIEIRHSNQEEIPLRNLQ
jgi:hypothetical protein